VLLRIEENDFNIMKRFLLLLITHHIFILQRSMHQIYHLHIRFTICDLLLGIFLKVQYGFVICCHISLSFQIFEPIFLFIASNNQHWSLVLDLLFQRGGIFLEFTIWSHSVGIRGTM